MISIQSSAMREIPTACPGTPASILDSRKAAQDEAGYEFRTNQLVKVLRQDFARFEARMPENMRHLLSDVLSADDSYDFLDSMRLSM